MSIFLPRGSKGAQRWGKLAHLLTNGHKNLQIWSHMIFNMRNLMVASTFSILEYFAHFGAPQGSKGGTKWGKLAHLLTNGHMRGPHLLSVELS